MKRITIIFLLLFSFLQDSICCSCGGEETVDYHYKNADIVFHGKLLEKGIHGIPDTTTIDTFPNGKRKTISVSYENCYSKYTFKVYKHFKGGIESDTVEILGHIYSSCNLPTELNIEHIVYAYNSSLEVKYYSNYCSGTEISKRKNLRKLVTISSLEYDLKNDTNFHQFYIDSWINHPKDTLKLYWDFQQIETGVQYSQIIQIEKKEYELLMWTGKVMMETPTQLNKKLNINIKNNSFEIRLGTSKTKYLATRKKNCWELTKEKNYR